MTARSTTALAVGFCLLYGGIKLFRGKVYDFLIVRLNGEWYREVLELLPPNSRLLDVGIGTGRALITHKGLLKAKQIFVDGVDYDYDYIVDCKKNVSDCGLEDSIHVHYASIYDYTSEAKYDAAYFSASLMIMPDQVKALKHSMKLLKPEGNIYVTQTIQTKPSWFAEKLKPLLKFFTTVDFGQVTYERDILKTFEEAGLVLKLQKCISGATKDSTRSYRLFVLEKKLR